ncbi:MAG TPA: hypothetical protein ENN99_05925 [Chloroflexi bacterium]|nr:hypothetical protein [Chloroflexota bacterium]
MRDLSRSSVYLGAAVAAVLILAAALGAWLLRDALRPVPEASRVIEPQMQDAIEAYLVEHVGLASFGGEVFCAVELLDADMQAWTQNVYVWALCAEYYVAQGELTMGAASSLPVALVVRGRADSYQVVEHRVPGDGSNYGPDIEALFSPRAREEMCPGDPACINARAARLEQIVAERARLAVEAAPPDPFPLWWIGNASSRSCGARSRAGSLLCVEMRQPDVDGDGM